MSDWIRRQYKRVFGEINLGARAINEEDIPAVVESLVREWHVRILIRQCLINVALWIANGAVLSCFVSHPSVVWGTVAAAGGGCSIMALQLWNVRFRMGMSVEHCAFDEEDTDEADYWKEGE